MKVLISHEQQGDSKDVGLTWKSARSQFQAMRMLKSVDFRSLLNPF